jgi:hypothetical protein
MLASAVSESGKVQLNDYPANRQIFEPIQSAGQNQGAEGSITPMKNQQELAIQSGPRTRRMDSR